MSHSTYVRVAIGHIALEFTFGSGQLAEQFGVIVGHPRYFSGEAARALIRGEEFQERMPDFEFSLVKQVYDQREAEFTEDDKEQYALSYNDLWVTITHHD